jgi:YD repeat-containing protein
MKPQILAPLILLLFTLCIGAQDNPLNKIVPPSPNAANLGKVGDIPMNGYTGSATISIPLYAVKEKGITVPISLEYSSNGSKPNEIPSWVGRGWNLNAGGVITRSVKHVKDEYYDNGQAGFFFDPTFVLKVKNGTRKVFLDTLRDTEPDVFYFNFLGYSGKFYKNNTVNYKNNEGELKNLGMESVPHYNFKYDFYQDGNIYRIVITSDDGTKYYFGQGENGDIDVNGGVERTTTSGGTIITTAWYLKKIISPQNDKVEFVYSKTGVNNFSTNQYSYQTSWTDGNFSGANNETNILSTSVEAYYLSEICNSSSVVKLLNEDHPFSMISSNPLKYKRLKSIQVFKKENIATPVHTFDLKYKSDTYHLMLYQIIESAGALNSKPTYTFEYYNYGSLPTYYSSHIDHWGYYNGNNNPNNNVFMPTLQVNSDGSESYPYREPNAEVASYDMLKTVTYPTGGTVTLEYEPNKYSKVGTVQGGSLITQTVSETIAGGVRVSKIIYNSGDAPNVEKQYTYFGGILYQKPKYYISGTLTNRVTGVKSTYWERSKDSYFPLGSPHITYSKIQEKETNNGMKETVFSTLEDYTDVINDLGGQLKVDKYAYTTFDKKRGKIKSEKYFDNADIINPVKEVSNTYTTYSDKSISAYEIIQPCIINSAYQESPVFFNSFFYNDEDVPNPANLVQPYISYYRIPTGFDYQTERINTDHFSSGDVINKETYTYSPSSYEENSNIFLLTRKDVQNSNTVVTQKYTYPSSLFPSKVNSGIYKQMVGRYYLGYPVEETESRNNAVVNSTLRTYKLNEDSCFVPDEVYTLKHDPYMAFAPFNGTTKDLNYYVTPELKYEKYDFDNNLLNFYQKNGEEVSILWGYNNLFPVSVIKNSHNIYSVTPGVNISTDVCTLGTSNYISVVNYTNPSTNVYKLKNIHIDNANDLVSFELGNHNYDELSYTPLYYIRNSVGESVITPFYFTGTVKKFTFPLPIGDYYLELILPNPNINSILELKYTLEDYKEGQISSKCFFSCFEENSSANYVTDSHSGSYSYRVAPGTYAPANDFGKWTDAYKGKYKVSAWVKTPSSFGSGKGEIVIEVRDGDNFSTFLNWQAISFGSTSNQWQYVEGTLDLTSVIQNNPGKKLNVRVFPSNIDPTNSLYVDDLRFCPSEAQMTTYTYDPLLGMTSSTDPNNVTSYYEYDSFGRLKAVKDNDRNSLKQYNYHYKGETTVDAFNPSISVVNTSTTGQIQFSASDEINSAKTTYQWDFGDGQTSTLKLGTHKYATNNTYTVTLTVSNPDFGSYQLQKSVSFANNYNPDFVFTVDGGTVSFLCIDGLNSETNTTDYSLNFGDNTFGGGAFTSHSYTASGTYTVTLDAYNSFFGHKIISHTVTVIITGVKLIVSVVGNLNPSCTYSGNTFTYLSAEGLDLSNCTVYLHEYYCENFDANECNSNPEESYYNLTQSGAAGAGYEYGVPVMGNSNSYVHVQFCYDVYYEGKKYSTDFYNAECFKCY